HMTARVLVVDDLPTNVKVLEAKLTAEYFTVITATSGQEAIEAAKNDAPDIILLDVMMPEMDGFETCRRLKADTETAHIPVVMVTALSDIADRVTGLEAGADDFLTKPVNDVTLFARIRSLARIKRAIDEWRMQEETYGQLGVTGQGGGLDLSDHPTGTVLVVDPDEYVGERVATVLEEDGQTVSCVRTADAAMEALPQGYDLVITSLYLEDSDGLRFCSQLRAIEEYRTMPVLLVIEPEEVGGLAKGFELGINDYLVRPVDANELKVRVRTQLRQKRYRESLQENYRQSLSLALIDDLTGLYNHRYLSVHMDTALRRAVANGKPLSVLMLDIDFFKKVNDTHGHAVGDKVLKELASRMTRSIREFDTAARRGGEEFVVVMPECGIDVAVNVAERLRHLVADQPFCADDGQEIPVTVSIGIAARQEGGDTAEDLLARSDDALYEAKRNGRNRVEVEGGGRLEPGRASAARA
ncbi:MAG TPA: PleD family two-component system response regulator, partial [Alphaproteobacteria bacterium]|nr:PleD family two-component system response regulator [Alphaproteobacteria bacterium]